MADRYFCNHPDCKKIEPKSSIPYEDMPYTKIEILDGKYEYTCLKHMTDEEIAQRYQEAYSTFEVVEAL